jgi:predicted amidohydrolase
MTARDRKRFTVAAAQMTAGDDLERNLATCWELAVEAAKAGAELLALPENFSFLGARMTDKFAAAENLSSNDGLGTPGPTVAALVEIATRHNLWVIAGGMPERIEGEETTDDISRVYNTCVVMSPAGQVRATYRKMHLFDIAIPGKAEFRESDSTAPGADLAVVETDLATLGLSICYDLRFPELYRELATRGAELLFVPAAFTAHTGAAHWHTLLRARAIENQCYVLAPAQAGRHNPKRESYGHALIIDPWGTVIAEVDEGTGLAIAEVDLGELDRVRREMPCREHRVL